MKKRPYTEAGNGKRDIAPQAVEGRGLTLGVPPAELRAENRPIDRAVAVVVRRDRHISGQPDELGPCAIHVPTAELRAEDRPIDRAVAVVVRRHRHVGRQPVERGRLPSTYQPPTDGRNTAISILPSPS